MNNVRLKDLKAICDFVGSSEGEAEYIEHKSSLYSRNSSEQIEFLLEIGLIRKQAGRYLLSVMDIGKSNEPTALKRAISDLVMRSAGRHGKAVRSFVQKFEITDQGIIYRPSNLESRMHSGTRNFLIELDMLNIREDSGQYVLDEAYAAYAGGKASGYDLESFERDLERQREIGMEAECLIIRYEVDRLTQYSAGRELKVVRISEVDVSAGYDIRSWTYLADRDEYVERYIEVKATAGSDQKFFWTRNEISKAEELRESYFLYLVPFSADIGLDLAGLRVIRDPFVEILDKEEWVSQPEVLMVYKQSKLG